MRKPQPPAVPVSIPHVVLDVHEDGTLTATIDGTRLDPDPDTGSWRRASFGQIVDRATSDRAIPARVEVRENDGSTFTDIIAALPRRTPPPEPEPATRREQPAPPVFHTVTGDGFVPGEDVAVAVVTGHTEAAHTGTARALIDPARFAVDQTGGVIEVALIGRISKTVAIRRLP